MFDLEEVFDKIRPADSYHIVREISTKSDLGTYLDRRKIAHIIGNA